MRWRACRSRSTACRHHRSIGQLHPGRRGGESRPDQRGRGLGSAQGRLDLTAPVAQLLNHSVYAGANNAIAAPLILPRIAWTPAASFSQSSASQPLNITDPALPGFALSGPPNAATSATAAGTVSVAELPAKLAAQHMPPGVSGALLLTKITGTNLPAAALVTLPNSSGLGAGAMLSLVAFNPLTGGHDVVGKLVVSADGKTMTSIGPISLGSATPAATPAPPAGPSPESGGGGGPIYYTFQFCWLVAPWPRSPTRWDWSPPWPMTHRDI